MTGPPLADTRVEVDVDVSKAERDGPRKAERAGNAAGKAYADGFERGAAKVTRGRDGRLRDERGRFVTEGGKAGAGAGKSFSAQFGQALRSLPKVFGGVLAGAAAAGALASTTTHLVAFTSAAAPAAGALLVLPGAFAVAATAALSFNAAIGSTSDAFKAAASGDAAALAEQMRDLAPAAQSVVKEVAQLAPEFDNLRKSGQQAFFSEIQGEATRLAKVFGGPLRNGITQVAREYGLLAKSFAVNFDGPRVVEILNNLFKTTATSVRNLRDGLVSVTFGIMELVNAGLPGVESLSTKLGNLLERFGDFLTEASRSGRALVWMQEGAAAAGQLGRILGNVGGILRNVFANADVSGGGLLYTLERVTSGVREFTASAEGASAIQSVFAGIKAIADATMPGIRNLSRGLDDFLAALADGLSRIDLSSLGTQLGELLKSVSPLLPGLGDLVNTLGHALAEALRVANPLIKELAELFGNRLAEAWSNPRFKQGITDIADGLLAVVEVIVELIGSADDFERSLGSPAEKAEKFGEVATGLGKALIWLAEQMSAGINAVRDFKRDFDSTAESFASFRDRVSGFVNEAGRAILDLPGKIVDGIVEFGNFLVEGFTQAFNLALQAVGVGVGLILFAVLELPRLGSEAIVGFFASLPRWFSEGWDAAVQVTTRAINSISEYITGLPGRTQGSLSSFASSVRSWFEETWRSARESVSNGVNRVVEYVAALPGRVSAYAGALYSAGRNLIARFMAGLSQAGSFATDVGSAIVRAVRSGLNSVIGSINAGISSIDAVLPGSLPRIPMLARGAILNRATLAVVGESGPEVVVPLTRPARAVELAQRSGLVDLLARAGVLQQPAAPAGGTTVHAPITVNTVLADPELVARRVVGRLTRLGIA